MNTVALVGRQFFPRSFRGQLIFGRRKSTSDRPDPLDDLSIVDQCNDAVVAPQLGHTDRLRAKLIEEQIIRRT